MKLPIEILCPDCDDTAEILIDTLRNQTEYYKCYCGEWEARWEAGRLRIEKREEP